MKIISVAGQCGVGKDELSNYLAKKLNNSRVNSILWERIGFAHAVKKVFMDSFDVTWDFIEEWKRKDEIPEGFDKNIRKSLQFIGDGFRQIRSNIWIETAFRKDTPKIISDVRYLNEAQAIREHGGINILLWRPLWENDDPNPSESQIKPTVDWFVKSGFEGDVRHLMKFGKEEMFKQIPTHVKLFDFFFRNEGDFDALFKKVDEILIPVIEEKYGLSI